MKKYLVTALVAVIAVGLVALVLRPFREILIEGTGAFSPVPKPPALP